MPGRPREYGAFAFTHKMSRKAYVQCEPFFRAYFREPLKDEDEPVIAALLPDGLLPFINAPIGNLAGTLAIQEKLLDRSMVYAFLDCSEGISRDPLIDLTHRQTLYARMVRSQGVDKTVELAKICPHRKDPDQMTVVVSAFYALPKAELS